MNYLSFSFSREFFVHSYVHPKFVPLKIVYKDVILSLGNCYYHSFQYVGCTLDDMLLLNRVTSAHK